jgi:hypothetical protein
MSVIFQLFCAEDLRKLNDQQLDELSDRVGTILRRETGTPARPAALALSLNVSKVTKLPQQTPDKVNEALKSRFREVSHQLQSPPLQPSPRGFDFDNLLKIRNLPAKNKIEEKILQWAITCEVENYAFYRPLLVAKKDAYEYFELVTGDKPIGPDSPYSPLNRRHPLQSLYYDLNP